MNRQQQINPRESAYADYERQGYSAKHLVTAIFSGISSFGAVIIVGYIVIKLMGAVDEKAFETAAEIFLYGIVGLILSAGGVGLAILFRAIVKPGQQLPGFLGRLEPKDGL